MADDLDILAGAKATPLFSALAEEALAALLKQFAVRRYAARYVIVTPLSKADRFYVVLSGRVKVYRLSPRGDEQVLHVYGPGQSFGEAAVMRGGNYPAHAETLEDTAVLVVEAAAMKRAIAANPDLAMGMLAGLSAKLHEFADLIESLSLKQVPSRLAGELLRQADEAGGDEFTLKQAKRDLAGRLGTTPETLSRTLAKLRDAALIVVRGRHVAILNRRRLREIAEEG
jgi:CRP/FNR family transcriptional regulator